MIDADQVIRGVKNPSHVGLATRLRAARKSADLSALALAERAGMDHSVIRSIEGSGVPLLDTVEQIARALDVSPCWLAYGIEAPPAAAGELQCEEVGQRLQQVRSSMGVSRKGLAKLAGLSTTAISYIEEGQRMPSVATVEKIAKALKVDPCWLAFGAGPAPDLPQ